ncbi:MAG TPA: UDP-N-acetylmuramoyl-L-alanyl-D-glutamate--2,6-diaminopimelate ligase [Rhodocyclaceae bacterium]|jgi:UDP-N-acetylmuramoyl-L-alanyl-D-glutamate--2,6-diaminopimelate ligase|nr:UDP-N-acetylmuramoyl-L-alanyl-D-glutamate--2,6-diaminopimelate ligase [Rhodocyclaceae bacterium]
MNAQNLVLQVLNDLKLQGIAVTTLASDSRAVQAGDVFLAYPGELSDGRDYIDAALQRGAIAVVYEANGANIQELGVPHLAIGDLRALAAPLAAEVYGHPSEALWLIGVTGTNGKTSVTQWLAESFKLAGKSCAVVGTLGNGFPGALEPSPNTTPNALVLQQSLNRFVAAGAEVCAMEVSSIGIEEGRVDASRFAAAVFTNFTRDHLDYHGSMEAYAEAKARLFDWPGLEVAIINLDDPFGLQLLAHINGRIRCIGYTLNNIQAPVDECLSARNLSMSTSGVEFELNGLRVHANVVGRFNVSNLLAVMATMRANGIALGEAISACSKLQPPPGRMQTLGGEGAPLVVVDYAHTPDALDKVLGTLREVAAARAGKLHCVFGCGGDRDAGKRPLMGAVAERQSDHVVLTSDNPRSEDPAAILGAIRAGMKTLPHIEMDRGVAIRTVIAAAAKQDVVLLAGKGHEDYQEIKGERFPFSDLLHAKQALEARPC